MKILETNVEQMARRLRRLAFQGVILRLGGTAQTQNNPFFRRDVPERHSEASDYQE